MRFKVNLSSRPRVNACFIYGCVQEIPCEFHFFILQQQNATTASSVLCSFVSKCLERLYVTWHIKAICRNFGGQSVQIMYSSVTWYCRDRVSSCNIYAVQQDTQCVLMSKFYSAPVLARHVSDLIGPSSGAFCTSCIRRLCNGWTCRVVRVLPHTKVCIYSFYKTLLRMDRWGPKHVELKPKCWLKLIHWDHTVYLVGLYIYIRLFKIPNSKSPRNNGRCFAKQHTHKHKSIHHHNLVV